MHPPREPSTFSSNASSRMLADCDCTRSVSSAYLLSHARSSTASSSYHHPSHKASSALYFHEALDVNGHRGELGIDEQYNYDLSKAQLKASSRTSALLAGFAMVALVELQYDEDTPHSLLIVLAVVTTLLVSVHLLALMMSTCILPYMEASGRTQDSPHIRLKFYIDLSWLFSTCIGLVLFLIEIGVIFFVKFKDVGYSTPAYVATAMLVPVLFIFITISCLIHRSRVDHSFERIDNKIRNIMDLMDTIDISKDKVAIV